MSDNTKKQKTMTNNDYYNIICEKCSICKCEIDKCLFYDTWGKPTKECFGCRIKILYGFE